jgi:hypothetical protein
MSYQPILLGTPNNNDGDSLYAGGVKLNSNFIELYNALAGSTSNGLRIDLTGTTAPQKGDVLRWSTVSNKFVSGSSDAVKTWGSSGVSTLFITNNSGSAGVDSEITAAPNSVGLTINGRSLFNILTRNTSETLLTRGEINVNLGLNWVTSVSIYTTSLVVRGRDGLWVYAASAEDVSSYSRLMFTTGNTLVLEAAALSGLAVKAITDSSLSVAHTGMVQGALSSNLSKFTQSSIALSAGNGLIGGGDLSTNRTFYLDPRLWPEHIEGFLYDVDLANTIQVSPGSATHFSYSTTSAARISETSMLAFVSTSASMTRSWTTGWTTTAGGPAIIDTIPGGNGPRLSTWYYIFLLGNATNGAVDFVMSSNRDIATVSSQVFTAAATSSLQIVRRIGAVYTDSASTGSFLRFTTQRGGGNVIKFNWLATNSQVLLGAGTSAGVRVALGDPRITTALMTSATLTSVFIRVIGSSNTLSDYNDFSTAVIPQIPPIPGITARLQAVHNPGTSTALLFVFGEALLLQQSSNGVASRAPTYQVVRSLTSSVLNYHSITVPMTPDNNVVGDTQISNIITTSTGARIRQVFVSPSNQRITSNSLHYICEGFDFAR